MGVFGLGQCHSAGVTMMGSLGVWEILSCLSVWGIEVWFKGAMSINRGDSLVLIRDC
jgi:hypothetical protein